MGELKRTPLYEEHLAWGARMVEFGGWLMPVHYSGILEEHRRVRTAAGLFDVSHMGEIEVAGPQALQLVQKLITNDAARAAGDRIIYSPVCYTEGGVVDDILVYRLAADRFLLVVNAANTAKDYDWITLNAKELDVTVEDVSWRTAQLALQGPQSPTILQPLIDVDLANIGYYRWIRGEIAGVKCLISRTGYTGEDGFELYLEPEEAVGLWRRLLEAGREYGLVPAGLGARDTLRLEAGLPLYGHELAPDISPLEAGLGRFVHLEKGEFNGAAVLRRQKETGPPRRIVGLEMLGRGIPRPGYPVLLAGRPIGRVTSGSFAPTLEKNIALVLVENNVVGPGKEVGLEIRGRVETGRVVPLPFYRRSG